MLNNNLLILSDGLYGEVALEIAKSMDCYGEIALLDIGYGNPDYDQSAHGNAIGNASDYEEYAFKYSAAIAAFEDPKARLEWTKKLEDAGFKILPIISPKAFVGNTAHIEGGCIIEPMAFVGERVTVGPCSLIKAGAILEHACVIGYACNLECKCYIQTCAVVGNESIITVGSTVENYENYMKAREYE